MTQVLIEFKTTRPTPRAVSEIWNATVAFAFDAPLLVADSVVQFEAIGGTPISIPLRSNSFKSTQIQPFNSALLAFSFMQWSSFLSAAVAAIPIQTTVWTPHQYACLYLYCILYLT
jgi:hypothetical protein